jgi:hypothetical protein
MKTLRLNNGFSLIEVNMAVFVMAVGVLSMAVLYPLGLRESTQGQADLKQSMFADCVLNQVVALASQTNVTWNSWKNIPRANNFTEGGWQDVKDLPPLKTDTGEAVFSKVKIPSEMASATTWFKTQSANIDCLRSACPCVLSRRPSGYSTAMLSTPTAITKTAMFTSINENPLLSLSVFIRSLP